MPESPFNPQDQEQFIPGEPTPPRCIVQIIQEASADGRLTTHINGHIEPGGVLSGVACMMVLSDAMNLILQKMAIAEQTQAGENGQDKPKKVTLYVPERFQGGNL